MSRLARAARVIVDRCEAGKGEDENPMWRELVLALEEQEASPGLVFKGWWCMAGRCSQFNGEEHSPRTECRSCGTPKPDGVRKQLPGPGD